MSGRSFTRVNYSVGASIRYDNNVVMCSTDNLSLQGMHLKTDQDVPLNVPVHVTVYHSGQSSFRVNGKVMQETYKMLKCIY
jgi:hypothetical protein